MTSVGPIDWQSLTRHVSDDDILSCFNDPDGKIPAKNTIEFLANYGRYIELDCAERIEAGGVLRAVHCGGYRRGWVEGREGG